jgi:hypothetical protein
MNLSKWDHSLPKSAVAETSQDKERIEVSKRYILTGKHRGRNKSGERKKGNR